MYNQLTQITADYDSLLYIANTTVMPVTGDKNQIVHEFLDGRTAVVNLSDSFFDVEIQFENTTDFKRQLVDILYHDSGKANGGENTFYWLNPRDSIGYVVRFLTPIRNIYKPGHISSVDGIKMKISGYKGQMISDYTNMRVYVAEGYCEFYGPIGWMEFDAYVEIHDYMDFI